MVVVDNIGNSDVTFREGHCYFQIVAFDGSPVTFELVDELSATSRGQGGFGSTGK